MLFSTPGLARSLWLLLLWIGVKSVAQKVPAPHSNLITDPQDRFRVQASLSYRPRFPSMNRSESQTLRRRDWIPLGGYEFRKIVGVGWIDELTNIDYRKGVPDRGRISTATCSMCSQARQADHFAVEVQGE